MNLEFVSTGNNINHKYEYLLETRTFPEFMTSNAPRYSSLSKKRKRTHENFFT